MDEEVHTSYIFMHFTSVLGKPMFLSAIKSQMNMAHYLPVSPSASQVSLTPASYPNQKSEREGVVACTDPKRIAE